MPLTKTQLQSDLETLKKAPEEMQEQIAVDKAQVIELLQAFEDLEPEKIQQLKARVEDMQEVKFETFQQIIDELINIVGNKEDAEIKKLLEAKEVEIKQIIDFFKNQLNALRQEVETSQPASAQAPETASQVEITSPQGLKTLFEQKRKEIEDKKLLGLFKVDWAFKGFEELVLKEAQGQKLSWWEKLKKWWYALILGFVAGDVVKKANEALEAIKDPIEAIKSKFWPEAIEQYREKLWEAFLDYLRPVMPANLSSQAVKEKWQKAWENMWGKYDRILVNAFPSDWDLSKLDPSRLFTIGGMFAFDLTKNLWQQGLISVKQLWVELVREGSSYAFHMSIKWAQMIWGVVAVGLGKITLENWRRLISMEWESAKAKAVWLYRLMETWIWEILKFGAKLPGYALSSAASLDEVADKFKVFVDMWKGEGEFVLNQLEELARLAGGWSEDFKRFKDLIKQVQESIAVYNAAKFAKTQSQLEENLKRFLPPEEVGKVMEKIEKSWGDDFFKKVGNYLVWEAEKIKNVDSVVSKTLLEKAWIKWKASDLRKSIRYLGEVVEEGWRIIIAKESVLGRFTNVFRKAEVAWKSMIVVDAKALTQSSKDLRGALKLAMKQSPHLLSEFLGASPIFLLTWLELQECKDGDEGCSPEKLLGAWLDVMMDLIPIVGPVRFLWGNRKEADDLQEYISQYAAGFGWLGLDTRYFVRSRGKKWLPKAVIDALLEPARAVGNVGRFMSRSATVGWDLLKAIGKDIKNFRFTTFRRTLAQGWELVRSSRWWWIGVAAIWIFAGVEVYKWWQNKQKVDRFKEIAKEIQTNCENRPSQDCEQYLRERFANSKNDMEKILITSVLVYQNFGVGPQSMEIKRDKDGRLKIVFNGHYNLSDRGNPFVLGEVPPEEVEEETQKSSATQDSLLRRFKEWALQIVDWNKKKKVYQLTPLAKQIREYVELLWWEEVYAKVKWDNIKPFAGSGSNNLAEISATQTSS